MYPVGTADHDRMAMGAGQLDQGGEQRRGRFDEQVGRVAQHPAPRRVDHIARREAVVDPRTLGGTDARLHHIDERRDIVVGDGFTIGHCLHERVVHLRCSFAACGSIGGRHQPEFGMSIGGQQLDLEPSAHARRIAEHGRHIGK